MITEEQYIEFCDKADKMMAREGEVNQYDLRLGDLCNKDNKFQVNITGYREGNFGRWTDLEDFLSDKEKDTIREWVIANINVRRDEAKREFEKLKEELIAKQL